MGRHPHSKRFKRQPLKDRRQRVKCDCGTPLKLDQAFYCSTACRDRYMSSEKVGLLEPKTNEQVATFNKTVFKFKDELMTDEKREIKRLTPSDDSPEAEKRLRDALTAP